MEPGLDGTEGDPERGRHVGQGITKEVVEDDDRPFALAEPAHDLVDQFAVGVDRNHVRDSPVVHGLQGHLDPVAMMSTSLIEAGVHGESMKPDVEPIGVSKLRQIPPGSDQCLLDRVACEVGVPEDETCCSVQPHDSCPGELREGVMIALPCLLDQPSLVQRSPRFWHGRVDVLRG